MFRLNGSVVECDTAEEIGQLLARQNGHASPKKMQALSKAQRGASKSWRTAKRVAKRLNREDVGQVRSEIAAGILTATAKRTKAK